MEQHIESPLTDKEIFFVAGVSIAAAIMLGSGCMYLQYLVQAGVLK